MVTALSVRLAEASETPSSPRILLTVELLARFADRAQVQAAAPAVLLTKLLALLRRQAAERAGAAVAGLNVERPCDRHVGPNARQRLKDLALRTVNPGGQRTDCHNEPDAHAQPQRREQRPAEATPQLRGDVRHIEHAAQENRAELRST